MFANMPLSHTDTKVPLYSVVLTLTDSPKGHMHDLPPPIDWSLSKQCFQIFKCCTLIRSEPGTSYGSIWNLSVSKSILFLYYAHFWEPKLFSWMILFSFLFLPSSSDPSWSVSAGIDSLRSRRRRGEMAQRASVFRLPEHQQDDKRLPPAWDLRSVSFLYLISWSYDCAHLCLSMMRSDRQEAVQNYSIGHWKKQFWWWECIDQ